MYLGRAEENESWSGVGGEKIGAELNIGELNARLHRESERPQAEE